MSVLQISLFGTLQLSHDQSFVEVKIPPKVQALLAYLLLQGPRLHPREILVDLFWRDYEPNRARSCLSTTLWRLRQVLEPGDIDQGTYLLTPPTDEISFNWNSNHWLDVVAFEEKVKRVLAKPISAMQQVDVRSLEEALKLYRGDLLENLYDDWAIREQERLRGLYLDSLEHLMRYYQQHGVYAESLAYGRRILQREPLREEIHREMIRLYLANGQRALAVRQYERCRDVLKRELGLPPMEETELVYAQAITTVNQPQVQPIQPVLRQLSQAIQSFEDSHRQLKLATEKFEYSQQLLQQALKRIDHSLGR